MPRNPDGSYTLPLPPVVSGSTVESSWANTTMTDLGGALADSLSRTAQGSMSQPLKLVDGAAATPGMAFVNEANTGFHHPNAGDLYCSVLGVDYMRWTSSGGVQIYDSAEDTWINIVNSLNSVIVDMAWSDNVLTSSKAVGPPFTVDIKEFVEFKSGGIIRHLSSNSIGAVQQADTTDQSRFTADNDGNMTLTVIRPTGADPDLGEVYCVEGSVLITNGATPGVVTLNNDAGAIPAVNILGVQNTDINAIMILTYCIHREAGDTYHEVYSWCT